MSLFSEESLAIALSHLFVFSYNFFFSVLIPNISHIVVHFVKSSFFYLRAHRQCEISVTAVMKKSAYFTQ